MRFNNSFISYIFASAAIVTSALSAQTADSGSVRLRDSAFVKVQQSGTDSLMTAADSVLLTKDLELIFGRLVQSIGNQVGIFGGFGTTVSKEIDEASQSYISKGAGSSLITVYPFQDLSAVGINPNQSYLLIQGSRVDFSQTQTLLPGYKTSAVIDGEGNYIFEDRFGIKNPKKRLKQKIVIRREVYLKFNFDNEIQNTFSKAVVAQASSKEERKSGAVRLFSTSVTTNETFQKIFGGDEVAVDATGNINLNLSGASEKTSSRNTNTGKNTQFTPKFEQKQKFLLRGTIGKKVEILFDQDSEREFNFENSIKVTYTGFDDEILQKLEAGNIDLSLPGTEFVTQGGQNKGLFGVKAIFKLANLNVTAIASIQNGEKSVVEFNPRDGQKTTKTLAAYEYAKAKFFFFNSYYHDHYEDYSADRLHNYNPGKVIDEENIKVYVSTPLTTGQGGVVPLKGIAIYNDQVLSRPDIGSMSPDQIKAADPLNFEEGNFREIPKGQYIVYPYLGCIVILSGVAPGEKLAVYFKTADGTTYGDLATTRLKLLWKAIPSPADSTWNLEMKNVYDFGAESLTAEDAKTLNIKYRVIQTGLDVKTLKIAGQDVGLLKLLHVDESGASPGKPSDDIVDPADNTFWGLDYRYGWLIFPKLRPFDPSPSPLTGFNTPDLFNTAASEFENVRFKSMYDTLRSIAVIGGWKDFNRITIDLTAAIKSSNTVNLGINVLEGSEVVRLNGDVLTKDIGYTIDYFSGTVQLLDPRADISDIRIEYEQAQLFQVDKKSIFGARAEYSLADYGFGQNSFIGTTALFHSSSTINKRVQLNEEPFNNFIWDANTNIELDADYLTKFVNWIPTVNSTTPSKISFSGEFAKLYTNPNTSNGLIRDNENGVAYIDDFEALKRTFPIGTTRKTWALSSTPLDVKKENRGYVIWTQRDLARQDISMIETNPADRVTTLNLALQPKQDIFGDYRSSWGGILRGFPLGGVQELADSKFIELWVKNTGHINRHAKIHVDLGSISEDQNGDGRFNHEVESGADIDLLTKRDFGLDGLSDKQEADSLLALGISVEDFGNLTPAQKSRIDSLQSLFPWGVIGQSKDDPFGDNWNSNHSRPETKDSPIANGIKNNNIRELKPNGTEKNLTDGLTKTPDTEDINATSGIETVNSYLSYVVSTDTNNVDKTLIIGRGRDDNGWILYRIPILQPNTIVNSTSIKDVLQRITNARVWISPESNDSDVVSVQIAEFQLINSEWRKPDSAVTGILLTEGSFPANIDSSRLIEISSISTDEGQGYTRPPNVKREVPIDQGSGTTPREIKEQSLLLRINALPAKSRAIIYKGITSSDFRNYGRIRMFVHGSTSGSIALPNQFADSTESPLNLFLRFGDNFNNYYEVEQPLYAGWAEDKNSVDVDLKKEMASPKFSNSIQKDVRGVKSINLDGGKIIHIKGNPSLDRITQLYVGVINKDQVQTYIGDVWFDELRVTDANDNSGIAAKGRLAVNFADLASFSGYLEYRTADFHNVEQRFVPNGGNSKSWALNGNVNLHKFYIERYGISLPVNANYSKSITDPKFLPANDILVSVAKKQNSKDIFELENYIENLKVRLKNIRDFISPDSMLILDSLVRDSTFQDSVLQYNNSFTDRIQSISTNTAFSITFSKTRNENNFWLLRYTVDNITSNFNYSFSEQKNPSYAAQQNRKWETYTAYNLPIPKNTIKPLSFIPFKSAPLVGNVFKNLSETEFNYSLLTSVTTDFRLSSTRSHNIERDGFGRSVDKPIQTALAATRSYGLSASPWQSLTSTIGVSFNSDLKGVSSSNILKGIYGGLNPFNGFNDFIFQKQDTLLRDGDTLFIQNPLNRDFSVANNFSISYTPLAFSFLSHTISYTAVSASTRDQQTQSVNNQSVSLSRKLQFDYVFSLRNFIGSVKEPFNGKAAPSQSPDDAKRNRRDRFKTGSTEKTETRSSSDSAGSGGFSMAFATRKAGSLLELALNTINDTRFNIGFENRAALSGLDQRVTPGARWFGYTSTDKQGFAESIFSFDLDNINQFHTPGNTDRLRTSYGKTINYGFVYGFNFNYFTLDLKYDHIENRTLAETGFESISRTESQLFPYLKKFPFPLFYDISIRANNVGKWPIFNLLAGFTKTMGFSLSYNLKKTTSLNEYRGVFPVSFSGIKFYDRQGEVDLSRTILRISGRDYLIQSIRRDQTFPQLNFDITWNGNITQNIAFVNTNSIGLSPNTETTSNAKRLNSNMSYVKRGGFRVPFWFLKKKQLENEVRMTLAFSLLKSVSFNQTTTRANGADPQPKKKTDETTQWHVEPRIDYSFTRWITGGMFFSYDNTKTLLTGTITRKLFGLTVNITIGA